MIPCLLLLVVSLNYASAASVPPTLDLTRNPALATLPSASLSTHPNTSVVDGDVWLWYCTKASRWYDPEMVLDDCLGVIEYFYFETMQEGGRKKMEFVAPGAKKATYVETQKTPRRYTFGTCTLALVMVEDFPDPGSLPGGAKKGPVADISDYLTLVKIAENLVQQCVRRRREMGWQQAGLRHGIGVFIWSTSSDEDRLIEADEPRFSFPFLEKPRNGSAASN